MFTTEQLKTLIQGYFEACEVSGNTPSQNNLAKWLSVAPQTISNYKYGRFNGFRYTKNPSPTRLIDNIDMPLITDAINEITERKLHTNE